MGIYLLMIAGAMLLIMSFEDLIGHYPDFPERLAGPGNPGNSLITDGNVNKIGIYVNSHFLRDYILFPISVLHFCLA